MEQSKALHKLNESVDLIRMVEDLIAPGALEKIAPTSWAGIRVILKGVREGITVSQSVLTQNLIQRARNGEQNVANAPLASQVTQVAETVNLTSVPAVPSRQDLKASLAKFIERESN